MWKWQPEKGDSHGPTAQGALAGQPGGWPAFHENQRGAGEPLVC